MRVGVTEPRDRPPRREPAQPAISGTTRTQRYNKKAASQRWRGSLRLGYSRTPIRCRLFADSYKIARLLLSVKIICVRRCITHAERFNVRDSIFGSCPCAVT